MVMNSGHQGIRLYMVRPDLKGVPECPAPEGFAVRWFQPGDDSHWLRIQTAAEPLRGITPGLFADYFGARPELLPERQCFLQTTSEVVIGTATAWFDPCFESQAWGRVHWVAVIPEYQGRGLSKVLMSAVCRRLHELRHSRAYLVTGPQRPAALRLYLRFGFRPHPRDQAQRKAWAGLAPDFAAFEARP